VPDPFKTVAAELLSVVGMTDWRALTHEIAGDVVRPDSPEYDSARMPQLARFQRVRPQAVVRCASPFDVARTLSFAGRAGLPLAIRSGGHCFAGRSSTDGLLLDVSPMNAVRVAGDVATVGAGARLGDIYATLGARGRTIAAGCGPTVGIAGLALGGGIGILGRRYGLTADQLLGAQVVLADGRILECDDAHDPDLFWALRGGGHGHFGVVTSLRFATVPAAPATAFVLSWPAAAATSVISAWSRWAPATPDELAPSLLVSVVGGRPLRASIFGAMQAPEGHCRQVLDEVAGQVGEVPIQATFVHDDRTKQHLGRIGDEIRGSSTPGNLFSKSEFFRDALPADTVAELVAGLTVDLPIGQSRELDFSPMGGAYNRVAPDATAFVHRTDAFLLKHEASVATDDGPSWLARSWRTAHRHGTGRSYQNFADPELPVWSEAYHGSNGPRLRDIKRRYDPDGLFG
jgi:FAD/FMN-containing dehydrogenase